MKFPLLCRIVLVFSVGLRRGLGLDVWAHSPFSRRQAVRSVATFSAAALSYPTWTAGPTTAAAVTAEDAATVDYHNRDRNSNKDALIREDYWYMAGKTPPRLLNGPLKGDDPAFNAFGSCESAVGSENPCTYVSLKQRGPAYSKYGGSIAYGATQMSQLGRILEQLAEQPARDELWEQAAVFVTKQERTPPPPIIDAELKMILLATALTVSQAFPSPSRELLIARFYVNEAHFASTTLTQAILKRDVQQARAAWEFGRDSWNSYFQIVNRSISPKVGDTFQSIV